MRLSSGNYGWQAKHSGKYLGYQHTDAARAIAGARLIQDSDPAAWHLVKSNFSFPTAAVRVRSAMPARVDPPACTTGWKYRSHATDLGTSTTTRTWGTAGSPRTGTPTSRRGGDIPVTG